MPGNFKKVDLRIIKTYNLLLKSLQKLLTIRSFERITVNELCEEAQLSRATFYGHFKDKYDLLEYWLADLKDEIKGKSNNYLHKEEIINQFIYDNKKLIKNLLEDTNSETYELVLEFLISVLDISSKKDKDGEPSQKDIVLSNFCAGGILNLLSWQIKNKFPPDLQMINKHLKTILNILIKYGNEAD